jgi:hypothetical protein
VKKVFYDQANLQPSSGAVYPIRSRGNEKYPFSSLIIVSPSKMIVEKYRIVVENYRVYPHSLLQTPVVGFKRNPTSRGAPFSKGVKVAYG